MTTGLLLRLLTAHFLTDFVLQPASWIRDRREKAIRSTRLIWHVLLTALVAYGLSGRYSSWWIPLVILITHYLIDLLKAYLPENIYTFLLDQFGHLAVLVGIWLIADGEALPVLHSLEALWSSDLFWLLALGYILMTWPAGILIGIATAKWRNQLTMDPTRKEGLASAGKWIGICERMLILTFVLLHQYTAIGFLITAKSILRFGDKDANAEKKTEYILVGTLLSFSVSVLLGILLSFALTHLPQA
ncbi:MAG: DUF3307 domain-containing protein [Bacteroidota bacterium]|nr:DUF3307 domain-containing protein [Bacteroidota bacterium]